MMKLLIKVKKMLRHLFLCSRKFKTGSAEKLVGVLESYGNDTILGKAMMKNFMELLFWITKVNVFLMEVA